MVESIAVESVAGSRQRHNVVVTVLAALWLIESPPSAVVAVTGPVVSDNMERYETALGERSRLDLADGSVALLNTQGRLRVRYTPHERSLFLDGGEIHVEVAHDANRPFTVYVGSRIVQAVGTAFSIKLESPSTIEVVVTDGRVKVGDRLPLGTEPDNVSVNLPAHAMIVSQGERVLLGVGNEEIEKLGPDDIDDRLSWRYGNIVFRGDSLYRAVVEISRYSPVEFLFGSEDLKKLRVAGMYRVGDVDGFLASIDANLQIEHERLEGNQILLKGRAE